jgi:hypothetical protein
MVQVFPSRRIIPPAGFLTQPGPEGARANDTLSETSFALPDRRPHRAHARRQHRADRHADRGLCEAPTGRIRTFPVPSPTTANSWTSSPRSLSPLPRGRCCSSTTPPASTAFQREARLEQASRREGRHHHRRRLRRAGLGQWPDRRRTLRRGGRGWGDRGRRCHRILPFQRRSFFPYLRPWAAESMGHGDRKRSEPFRDARSRL